MKHFVTFSAWILLLLFIIPGRTSAQHSSPDTLVAQPLTSSIKLDGKLNESIWQQAGKISNFTQRELKEGQPATEKTQVAVLYDSKNMYIGVWCFDKHPDKIVASQMKRDFDYGNHGHLRRQPDSLSFCYQPQWGP